MTLDSFLLETWKLAIYCDPQSQNYNPQLCKTSSIFRNFVKIDDEVASYQPEEPKKIIDYAVNPRTRARRA